MQRAALLLEQRLVCGVLHQCMAEQVFELRVEGGQPDQALGFKCVELEIRVGHPESLFL
jgi:hypothetical protein